MPETKVNTMEVLAAEVEKRLEKGYELVYVDYNDQLSTEQVAALARNDMEGLFTSRFEDFESESRHMSAMEISMEVAKEVIRDWEAEHDEDLGEVLDDWEASDERDDIIDTIKDRDTSNPLKELAHRTGRVLMRSIIVHEDDAWSRQQVKPTEVINAYVECAEEGTVFKRNKHNLQLVRGILNECSPEHSTLLGMIVYAVDVGDLYDLPNCEYVDIINPHLYLGNPFMGDGFCDGPIDGIIRVKREDMRTDRDAFGYGWDEVAGVVTSYYDVEIKPVLPNGTPKFQHDCDGCVFLGSWEHLSVSAEGTESKGWYDFYVCPQKGRDTCVVRFGADGEYESMDIDTLRERIDTLRTHDRGLAWQVMLGKYDTWKRWF